MDSNGPRRLSQSQPDFTPFAGVAQAGDVDSNGDLVGALTLRLAHAIDVDSLDALMHLERVRAQVLAAQARGRLTATCAWEVPPWQRRNERFLAGFYFGFLLGWEARWWWSR